MTIEKARKAENILYEMNLLDNDLRILKNRHLEYLESESPLKLASVPVSSGLFCKLIDLAMAEKELELRGLEVELASL